MESLAEVRARIDGIDDEIVRLLAERQRLVRAAAAFKADEQAVRAPDRVERVVALARRRAADAGLAPEVAEGGVAGDDRRVHRPGARRARGRAPVLISPR